MIYKRKSTLVVSVEGVSDRAIALEFPLFLSVELGLTVDDILVVQLSLSRCFAYVKLTSEQLVDEVIRRNKGERDFPLKYKVELRFS
jgi:hypothetical protein